MTDTRTIGNDVQHGEGPSSFDDEGVDALLKRFAGEETPPKSGEEVATETAGTEAPTATDETSETTEAGSEEGADGEKAEVAADPEHVVTVKVGEDEHKVPVKDLMRLYGQEAALTRKSQETSEALNRATQEGEKAVTILGALISRAEERAKPYLGIDFNLAAQRLPEDAYKQLRADAEQVFTEVRFLRGEADQFVGQVRQNRAAQHQAELKASDEALGKEIEGWNAEQRSEVAKYAVQAGLPASYAESIADPAAMKIIRKAMLFDRGAAAAKTQVKPVATSAPKKAALKPGATLREDNDRFHDGHLYPGG
jgi:hypothetical protein